MEGSITKLKNTLKQAGSSATKRRLTVFTHLQNHGPLSIGSLARALQQDIDRATVYRTVELFEKLGIVNRIWHGFKHQIELSEIFTPHHHHAVCQHCGKTIDINSSELESTLSRIAHNNHFLTLSHAVELVGYCSDCQK